MNQQTYKKSLQFHILNAAPSSGTFTPLTNRHRRVQMARFILLAFIIFLLTMTLLSAVGLIHFPP